QPELAPRVPAGLLQQARRLARIQPVALPTRRHRRRPARAVHRDPLLGVDFAAQTLEDFARQSQGRPASSGSPDRGDPRRRGAGEDQAMSGSGELSPPPAGGAPSSPSGPDAELTVEQADALILSRGFAALMLLAAFAGVVVSLAAWCFLEGTVQLQ